MIGVVEAEDVVPPSLLRRPLSSLVCPPEEPPPLLEFEGDLALDGWLEGVFLPPIFSSVVVSSGRDFLVALSYGLKAGDRRVASMGVGVVLSFFSSSFFFSEGRGFEESAPIWEHVCARSARGDFLASSC